MSLTLLVVLVVLVVLAVLVLPRAMKLTRSRRR